MNQHALGAMSQVDSTQSFLQCTADSTFILLSQNYFKPKGGLPDPPIVVLNVEQVCMIRPSLAWPHPVPQEREKGSGNFFYSSLFPRSVQCGTNHSAVLCHMVLLSKLQ